ncbi:N-acetylmannosamine-6-phosphate 2-epimerase [Rhodococcus sp. IEGM 1366]|uniref:N-acetylmannosamine-6-phosphate 2-epimerase n=1 Tax=Rhodococcus sp. IEGM 1366 TaxID=3082223 RepID=UPI002952F91B|nr:N-acetylmannosamine-6-phosphate 2-epimerase [Rhodococcus sp. IEGM 1366]MDV8066984.1 N-acetylmannosamine-6-phosphate 2-epimerase [Rhodococcus sp. IEGM 1366]
MTLDELLKIIRGKLVVSCQAGHGHALRDTATIERMARAAVDGGAAAIRCGGVGGTPDVAAVAAAVTVPVIGLTKIGSSGVFITPTRESALDVVDAGAQIVAADATLRERPDGLTFADTVEAVHARGALVMADCGTLEDGIAAAEAGADIISSTLAGYTENSRRLSGPDLELISELRNALPDAVLIAEGRYHSPEHAAQAIALGADSVVVGTAITDPAFITATFAKAIAGARSDGR